MDEKTLRKLFPHASASFIAENTGSPSAGKATKLEHRNADALPKARPVEKAGNGRYTVRYTSARKRLLDEDNTCSKFSTDALRYLGILPSDDPATTHIEVFQRKCLHGEEEHFLIEIWKE